MRPAIQSLRLAFDTLEAKSRCINFSPPDPVTTIRKINCEPDPANMDVDEYDQYELFHELQGLQPFWDKCQWMKDPLWIKLHSHIIGLPNTEEWLPSWFSSEELLDVHLPLGVSFHDPHGHSHSSSVLMFSLRAAGFPATVCLLRRNGHKLNKN